MPTTSEIGGVSGINPDSSRQGSREYYYHPKPENPYLRKLKYGEIVQGLIIDRVDEFIAEVRLPNGTYKAEISAKLRKGDSIFFKVQSVTPSLVLNIYAVTTRTLTKQQPVEELIRMLDIPDNEIYRELISFLIKYYNILIKDYVRNFASSLALLKPSDLEGKYQNSVLTTILFILEAELNSSSENNFQKIYPLFDDLKNLNGIFTNVLKYLSENNYSSGNRILNEDSDFADVISVFAKPVNDDNKETFFDLLIKITKDEISDDSIVISASEMLKLIDARNYWNLIAAKKDLPKFLVMPLLINNNIELLRLGLIKSTKSINGPGNTNLTLENHNGKYSLGLKYPTGYTTIISLNTENDKAGTLGKYFIDLIEYLSVNNYRVIYLDCTITDHLKMSIENFEKRTGLQSQGFSVVI